MYLLKNFNVIRGNMRIFILICSFILSINNVSCANSFDESWKRRKEIDEFVNQGPVFIKNINRIDDYKNLAKIISERIEYLPSKYNASETIKYCTIMFDGLEIRGIDSAYKHDVFIPVTIIISSSNWPVYKSLNVGQPKYKIIDALGIPDNLSDKKDTDQSQDEKFGYCGETDCVYFSVSDENINKIEFIYYND